MLGTVSVGWPGLLFQPLLSLLPYSRVHDDRKGVLVAIPFRLLQSIRFATLGLRPMVDQHSSMSLFGQHIFYTNICPEIAIISGFMRSLHLSPTLLRPKLRRCLSFQLVESAGNPSLSKAL